MADLTKEQKSDYAKTLYLTERGITQKEIAERTGVTEATVCGWVKKFGWDTMKKSLLTTKDEQLSMLYSQLDAANNAIINRDDGAKFPTAKEADAILKITAAISRLETETNIGDKMSIGREFLMYVRKVSDFEVSKNIGRLFNDYVKSCIK